MKWHSLFQALIRRLYFSRVTVTGAKHVPEAGPVLAVCLHRNGAVDGFVYRKALPGVMYMVKKSLRRSVMGRVFFDGVEVTRSEDGGGREANIDAMDKCAAWLDGGGRLAIFPEGTSALGPRHLPFKSGAARIALRHMESGKPLTILPMGIHYECPWAFRSRVEIVIGPAIAVAARLSKVECAPSAALDIGMSSCVDLPHRRERLQEMKLRMTEALESVGVNFADEATQELAQTFANIATLGTDHRYFAALKAMEQRLPPDAVAAWQALEAAARGRRLLRHQGVPLFPLRRRWAYVFLTLLLAVPVAAGAFVNLLPLAVAWWAGKTFPDDSNVIALWRILTGVPLLMLWAAAWCVAGLVSGLWWLPAGYLALTWMAVGGWYRLKKAAVVAWNGMFQPALRADAVAVHRAVLAALESPA